MSINHEQDKKFRIKTKVSCYQFAFYVFADTQENANLLAIRQMKILKRFKSFEILSVQESQQCSPLNLS